MKQSQLQSVYEEWIRSVESGETDKTFCAIDEDTWDDRRVYRLVAFGMDRIKSEIFQGTYGLFHDYGHIVVTFILDLSKKSDKKKFDSWFKDGKVRFGDWQKLRKFHY